MPELGCSMKVGRACFFVWSIVLP